ncbi:MAG TPA: hypothetical protein VGV68_09465 [Terriglobia bacterium]|nr:hypothetical protein [Terriglobia bacterium]
MMRRLIIVTYLIALALVSGSARAQDVISTFAGGGPNNLPAISANVDQPTSVAVAPSGVFYIASPSQNRVFKVDTSGTPQLTVFAGNGTPGYSGDAGLAVNASLRSPQAVALDSTRNFLYIADSQNNVVRRVDLNISPPTITTVAGNGSSGFSGDVGAAISAKLARPFGLAIDNNTGSLYIADIDNNRVRKVDAAGIITTVAGNGAAGFSGDGGTATVASLNQPMSVAFDGSGNLFISDSGNHRVRKVDVNLVITTVAGNGTSGSNTSGVPATSVGLSGRLGIVAVGAAPASLFIADTDDGLVRKVDGPTQNITTVAGNGCFGYSLDSSCSFNIANGDGTAAITASLDGPLGVAVDGSGNVYIADTGNLRVRKFVVAGNINTVAGNGLTYSGDAFPPPAIASLKSPQDVATDNAGDVFIADTGESLIRAVNTQATAITVANVLIQPGTMATVAGNGSFGFSGDGSKATSAKLNGPTGVAVDTSGNLYIADAGNQRVRKVDATGIITTVVGDNAELHFPSSVAVDSSGNIYIADTDNNRIARLDATTQSITTVAGMNGSPGFSGDGGQATSAMLHFPLDVVLDTLGNLYIADQSNNRIRKVDTSGKITTVAGNGTAGFSGDSGVATGAELNAPSSVAVDAAGNLFIADFGNQVIRVVDASTQKITTEAGDRVFGFGGDNGPAYAAMLANPGGVAIDNNDGNLFIADTSNDRIRKVTSPAVPGMVEDFSIAAAPSTITVTAGQTATYTLNIQPIGGFHQPISLSCTGAPFLATCSVSPISVTPDGINPFPVTVTVTTTAISVAEVTGRFTVPGVRGPKDLPLFFGLVFASGIAMYISIRRRQMKFLLALLVLSAITWIACGGGGSGPLPILKGTPGGTYTLNVTANSGGLNHNLNLGLNVN